MHRLSKIFKISLLGDGAVGKTSLRKRFLGKGYDESYSMTIGSDFAVKRIELDGSDYACQIWDLAGQNRFKQVREIYYKGTLGALLVFDITRRETLESIPFWIEELYNNNKRDNVPMILIGNKSDLRGKFNGLVTRQTGEVYAKQLSDWAGTEVSYIETSALDKTNVEVAFIKLMEIIKQRVEAGEL